MYKDPRLRAHFGRSADIFDGLDHVQAGLHRAHGMVRSGFHCARIEHGHAVIAVAEQLDAQTIVVLGNLVEPSEQVVENFHQLLGGRFASQFGETLDGGNENTIDQFDCMHFKCVCVYPNMEWLMCTDL